MAPPKQDSNIPLAVPWAPASMIVERAFEGVFLVEKPTINRRGVST